MCHHGHHHGPFPGHRQEQAGGCFSPAQPCKGGWIPGAGSQRMDPRGWIPVHRSQGTLQCCTSLLQNTQQPLPGDVQGARQRLCKGSRVPAASPLLLGPVAVVTLGQGSGLAWLWLVRDNPVLAKAAPNPRSCAMDAAILGLHRALSLPLSPPKNKGQQQGEPSPVHGVVPARVPAGCMARGAGPDAGAHSRDAAASASHQAAGAAGAVIDGLFISFSPAQDVSVRLRKIFLGSAAPSILPRLLLPPGSWLSGPGGLKPVQTQGRRSRELLSHSPWFLAMGRAGLSSASLGMDQAEV